MIHVSSIKTPQEMAQYSGDLFLVMKKDPVSSGINQGKFLSVPANSYILLEVNKRGITSTYMSCVKEDC